MLSVDGTYPSIWTHWTPVGQVNEGPPAGPREKAVTRWAEEAARKLPGNALDIQKTERLIQDAIDGALADARETIVVEVIPILTKIGRFQARNSMDEVTKILSSI